MNKLYPKLPWHVSFSYGKALEDDDRHLDVQGGERPCRADVAAQPLEGQLRGDQGHLRCGHVRVRRQRRQRRHGRRRLLSWPWYTALLSYQAGAVQCYFSNDLHRISFNILGKDARFSFRFGIVNQHEMRAVLS